MTPSAASPSATPASERFDAIRPLALRSTLPPAAERRPLRKVALIGNAPPRMCGIATFTKDLRDAIAGSLPQAEVMIVAMDDGDRTYAYGDDVLFSVRQDEAAAYPAAAARLNAWGAELVCVQHEYGIFGGPAGEHLLEMLEGVRAPVVVTLHTVLEHPNDDQRRVMTRLLRRASRVVVMAEKGREILNAVHPEARSKVVVAPHGAPDLPLSPSADFKARFDLADRFVLFTFGLLSPNKGVETVLRALPGLVKQRPDLTYVVLGKTHPHLVAREGEAYRESLVALAEQLGVSAHVRFVDEYADLDRLTQYLQAADIYVTPYLTETQITSGTLSYAVALGKPVVSTPYWHAQELLADGRGRLFPFGDSDALAAELGALIGDDAAREQVRRDAYAIGRTMVWSEVARRYGEVFDSARKADLVNLRSAAPAALPACELGVVKRMTDSCGIFQHSVFSVPNREHGYCLDDCARGLILANDLSDDVRLGADATSLAYVYASFVQHAWNPDRRRFRNFMAYDRSWLESEGSEDSFGRAIWALGHTAANAGRRDLRVWATQLIDGALDHVAELNSPRTWAFAILGLTCLSRAHPTHARARTLLKDLSARLLRQLRQERDAAWPWFEDRLAYDNARLPEALLRAGRDLGDRAMVAEAAHALDWLIEMQKAPGGWFRAVGTESFFKSRTPPSPFDQQPLEAAATVDACEAALLATGDRRYAEEARRAYDWYLGANDLGVRMAQPDEGGCYDGLAPDRANLNQGAESVLAFQMATCAMHRVVAAASAAPRAAGGGLHGV